MNNITAIYFIGMLLSCFFWISALDSHKKHPFLMIVLTILFTISWPVSIVSVIGYATGKYLDSLEEKDVRE